MPGRIIYFIDNKLGGITSFNYNIINNQPTREMEQCVIHLEHLESSFTRANISFNADKELHFRYTGSENSYTTIKRLSQLVPREEGVFILNDNLEMEMLDHFDFPQTVYQVVHDDYNLSLAIKYEHVVDVFIAHSKHFYNSLVEKLPGRSKKIFYLPHGVSIPSLCRQSIKEIQPLKLLFLGRMTTAKGIFDLPEISKLLDEAQVSYSWTCIGNGPELETLKQSWKAKVLPEFLSPATSAEVLSICSSHDVFVLPTKFEGSPVSLLETMSTGLVPVITDLPGGIREIVKQDIGFRLPMDDNKAFADALIKLSNDRDLLNQLSINSRNKIIAEFDVKETAAKYHELFRLYPSFYSPKSRKELKIGARLDHPMIPSLVTRAIRSLKN